MAACYSEPRTDCCAGRNHRKIRSPKQRFKMNLDYTKSSKFQAPSSREVPSSKSQISLLGRQRVSFGTAPSGKKAFGRPRPWRLEFGASLELGCWSLELRSRAYLLIEALVYIGLLLVVFTVGY